MLTCQHCGATAPEEATACPSCNAALKTSDGHAAPTPDSSDADTGAGTSPVRIALAILIVAIFGLGFWTLVRNSTDASTPTAAMLPQRRSANGSTPNGRAPAAAAPARADDHDDSALNTARRMTIAEAREAFEKGTAVLADVRSRDAYNTRHIKDAILLDEETLHGSLDHLPKDKLIITYCA